MGVLIQERPTGSAPLVTMVQLAGGAGTNRKATGEGQAASDACWQLSHICLHIPGHLAGFPLFLKRSQANFSSRVTGLGLGNEQGFCFRQLVPHLPSPRQGHLLLAGCDLLGMASRCGQPARPGSISYQAGKRKQAFLVPGFECALLFVFSTNLKDCEFEKTLTKI